MSSTQTAPSSQKLVELHRLRGIACLLVVTGHAFGIPALQEGGYLLQPAYLLIASSTVIFVVLAGILFQMKAIPKLNDGKTRTGEILLKRWRELRFYYVTLGTVLACIISINRFRHGFDNALPHFPMMMISGTMSYTYWYVPFFLLLMAVTPGHVWFARRRPTIQISLILAGLVIGALMHRASSNGFFTNFQNLAYYLPVFWLGMLLAQHWTKVLSILRGKEVFLGLVVSAIIATQVHLGQQGVYLHSIGEMWGKIDLFPLQKIALTLLLIPLLHRSRRMAMPLIDWCARNSLTIFFLHGPILIPFMKTPSITGFFVPEVVMVTAILIYASVRLDKAVNNALFRRSKPTCSHAETATS